MIVFIPKNKLLFNKILDTLFFAGMTTIVPIYAQRSHVHFPKPYNERQLTVYWLTDFLLTIRIFSWPNFTRISAGLKAILFNRLLHITIGIQVHRSVVCFAAFPKSSLQLHSYFIERKFWDVQAYKDKYWYQILFINWISLGLKYMMQN